MTRGTQEKVYSVKTYKIYIKIEKRKIDEIGDVENVTDATSDVACCSNKLGDSLCSRRLKF